uniref:Alpha-tubulin N-acetyltransferase n=1 Tax=Arion vulgaris TaxID=1028688 RepID=A0A0B6ZLV3_9EUPU
MDFSFNINELLKADISSVDSSLEICRERFHQLQGKLYEIIDTMGEASAKAQGLHGPITTGRKLTQSDHRLYIMKDSNTNSGKGSILGIIKVGRKKLFVYDNTKVQHEVEALCVLDFYIHESRQRMGCGRKIFDFMLSKENILVQHLAIDRPSSKLLSFMAKHYNLHVIIPQVYNFVIFEGFFNNRSAWRQPNFQHLDNDISKNVQNNWMMSSNSQRQYEGYMGASNKMYSRHGVTIDSYHNDRPTSTKNCYRQEPFSAHSSAYYNKMNGRGSINGICKPSMATKQNSLDYEFMTSNPLNHHGSALHHNDAPNNQLNSSNTSNLGRHQQKRVSPSTVLTANFLPHTLTDMSSFQLPDITPNQQLVQRSPSVLSVGVSYQPPNGTQGSYHNRVQDLNSQLVQQDNLLYSGNDMLTTHQRHYQKNGHQFVTAGNHIVPVHGILSPQTTQIIADDQRSLPPYKQKSNTSSWTVMGVLRDQNLNAVMSPGHINNKNSLW